LLATGLGFVLNFAGRKYLVFPEKKAGAWKPQINTDSSLTLENTQKQQSLKENR